MSLRAALAAGSALLGLVAVQRARAQWSAVAELGAVPLADDAGSVVGPLRSGGRITYQGMLGEVRVTAHGFGRVPWADPADVVGRVEGRTAAVGGVRGLTVAERSGIWAHDGGLRRRDVLSIGAEGRAGAFTSRITTAKIWHEEGPISDVARHIATIRVDMGSLSLSALAMATDYVETMSIEVDTTYNVGGFPFVGRTQHLERFNRDRHDAELGVTWLRARGGITALTGARLPRADVPREQWARITALAALGRGVTLYVEAGRRPSEPERRLEGFRYTAIGITLARGSLDRPTPVSSDELIAAEAPVTLAVLDSADARTIEVRGVIATRLEMMGDVTEWQPIGMRALGNGTWRLDRPVAPGAHRLLIRVDGGRWRPPPGLPVARDELNDAVGVLVVEP